MIRIPLDTSISRLGALAAFAGSSWYSGFSPLREGAKFPGMSAPIPAACRSSSRVRSAAVLENVSNGAVLDFFHNTRERWDHRYREAISPVLNKVRAFTADPLSP